MLFHTRKKWTYIVCLFIKTDTAPFLWFSFCFLWLYRTNIVLYSLFWYGLFVSGVGGGLVLSFLNFTMVCEGMLAFLDSSLFVFILLNILVLLGVYLTGGIACCRKCLVDWLTATVCLNNMYARWQHLLGNGVNTDCNRGWDKHETAWQ